MLAAAASPDRLNAIDAARRALLHGDPVPAHRPVASLQPWIVASWQRCLRSGRRPTDAVAFDAVSRGALRQAAAASRPLLDAARPPLEALDRVIAPTHYFSLLTDARGVVLAVGATADATRPGVHAIARLGVDLSERSVATTAIGAALGERQPVWLHRGEHFFDATAIYSCAGAPIFGPDGALVGMLDLTGVLSPERPELRHLVAQTALRIEAGLLEALPHARMLRVQWPGAALDEGAGLLAVDADGLITGADRAARQMLALRWQDARTGFGALDACFATPPGRLLALRADAPAEAVPLWSGLHALVAAAERPGDAAPARWRDAEAKLIRDAIAAAQGNVAHAARALGISRATMYRRLGALRRR